MNAIILAAGMGKRLGELTKNNTKCMITVNGVTLIDRMLHQLDRLKLGKIVIVEGYEGKKLVEYVNTLDIKTETVFIHNPVYDKTNNIYSLMLAKEHLLEDDTLLMESDIIFEDSVLETLLSDPRDTLALVDKYESWMDGTCVKLNENDDITSFISGKKFVFDEKTDYYKTVNIYKFSAHFSRTHYVPFLEAYVKALGNNEYYEQVLKVITMLDDPEIKAKRLECQKWYEIDDIQDLDIASSLFAAEDKMTLDIEERYGGYWRYPSLTDFCYLVNPYYPPKKLTDEMKASFEKLITEYPSGMKVISLLASKNFGVKEEHILAGNGAAELINCLCASFTGKTGFIRPTFEEYYNRTKRENAVVFRPSNRDMSFTAKDVIGFFTENHVDDLVLINPDNPSGNYIPKESLIEIIDFCKKNNIRIIVDESFSDFAEEENNSLLNDEILEKYKNLTVVKSISKCYGVPGIRLGILASADEKFIAEMKKNVSIWNINSFGEFFLQIAGKYEADYKMSLIRLRKVREDFFNGLCEIKGLRPIRSQANYIMAEITSGMTSSELTKILLTKHGILIKDLSKKIPEGQYVRISVRSKEDNDRILQKLRLIFGE